MGRRKTTKDKLRNKKRKLSTSARLSIGYPTQRKFPTQNKKRGVTPTSKMAYRTSVVLVGLTADLLTDIKIARLVKSVADRARYHISRGKGVSAKLMTMFAKLRSTVETGEDEDLVIVDLGEYDDEFFPNVGSEWEWRSRYSGYITKWLHALRTNVREMLEKARSECTDANFVFIDSIELTKWN